MEAECANGDRPQWRRIAVGFFPAELDGEIAAEAPEGAFRLMEQEGLRRLRNRADACFAEDTAGCSGAIDIEEDPDLTGVGQGLGAVADNL